MGAVVAATGTVRTGVYSSGQARVAVDVESGKPVKHSSATIVDAIVQSSSPLCVVMEFDHIERAIKLDFAREGQEDLTHRVRAEGAEHGGQRGDRAKQDLEGVASASPHRSACTSSRTMRPEAQ
jgi:hypothetical protein